MKNIINTIKQRDIAKLLYVLAAALLIGFVSFATISLFSNTSSQLSKLPLPEVSGGMRGELGIDKNINESNIDSYLNRSDSVYRDMRMLQDPATYEAIGGDSYLSGFVKGFEVVPFPLLVNVTGLPEAVGSSYAGKTLFTQNGDNYIANYEESLPFLEYYFPKDKTIFLMCGGGGYAGMTKNLLVAMGWDANKIYNVGGYWYYEGNNSVQVKRELDGKTVYDFWKVPYHDIDFSTLHKATDPKFRLSDEYYKGGELKSVDSSAFAKLISDKKSFIVMAHMATCPVKMPLTNTTKEFAKQHNITILDLNSDEFKKTELAKSVKYLPSAAIYRDGKLVAYLDAESDTDMQYYQSADDFKNWVTRWVNL